MKFLRGLAILFLLGGPCAPAGAAESYDNCTGFIDSVPAVITTQGTWCLRQDLATANTSGPAIKIQASNVTLDCNSFKLGGLAAGPATRAYGISAGGGSPYPANVTVRRCSVRGFYQGMEIGVGTRGGHVIEDNRLDGNIHRAITIYGDGSSVRRNLILNTGASDTLEATHMAMYADGDVDIVDNTIRGVGPEVDPGDGASRTSYGIFAAGAGEISGNRVRGIHNYSAYAFAIHVNSTASQVRTRLRDNELDGGGSNGVSYGLNCTSGSGTDNPRAVAKDNSIRGFHIAVVGCTDGGGNDP